MKTIKLSNLLILLFATTIFSCSKMDIKDFFDQHKDVVTSKNLPMSGDQEVPAKVTDATGSIDVSYNKKTKKLDFTVNWSNLTGEPTGSHIHGAAAKGSNAGIKYDFFSSFPKTVSGTFTGSVVVDEIAIKSDSLLNGFYYINIHTPTNPGGEIRGQILF
jgi:hypothetical protein